VGRWRILCPATWSAPDRETEGAYFERFSQEPDDTTDWGELRVATRLFTDPTEFERWCPVPAPMTGPHWIELENGRLVSHRRGLDLPLRDYEEDEGLYDGDLE
jgi:hypothetical protein